MVPGHQGSADNPFDHEDAVKHVLNQLTTKERLVCVWRRLGFRSRAIANHVALPGVEVEALYRIAVEKIRRLIGSDRM